MVPRTASKGGSKVDQYGRKIKEKNSIDNKETAELKEFYDANNSKEKKKSGEKKYDSRLEYLNLIARGEIDVGTEESEEEKESEAQKKERKSNQTFRSLIPIKVNDSFLGYLVKITEKGNLITERFFSTVLAI